MPHSVAYLGTAAISTGAFLSRLCGYSLLPKVIEGLPREHGSPSEKEETYLLLLFEPIVSSTV